MLNDYEITLPKVEDSSDNVIIIPIERYDYLMTEMGKLDALRTYLRIAKKPTFAAVEAMLGIDRR